MRCSLLADACSGWGDGNGDADEFALLAKHVEGLRRLATLGIIPIGDLVRLMTQPLKPDERGSDDFPRLLQLIDGNLANDSSRRARNGHLVQNALRAHCEIGPHPLQRAGLHYMFVERDDGE